MNFIPNVIMPYEDELLYSWIMRLAQVNGLSLASFCNIYLGNDKIQIDEKRGFLNLYNHLQTDIPAHDLYLQLSTFAFQSISYTKSKQIKLVNSIFRPEGPLNKTVELFINNLKVCPECIKEDIEKYGEPYLHRSHQLAGVNVCHKHHVILSHYLKNEVENNEYRDVDEHQLELTENLQDECNYADYVYQLLQHNIQSNAEDILQAIYNALHIDKSNKQAAIVEINKILNREEGSDIQWLYNQYILPSKNLIKVLMHLYPDPQDLLDNIPSYELIAKRHCDECDKDYYISPHALNNGWSCPYCDEKISVDKLFRRIVKISGNNEYVVKEKITTTSTKIMLYHKICGKDFAVTPTNFLFTNTRCACNQSVLEKEAHRRMKAYPQFQLLEYTYFAGPAKFLHKQCNETFTRTFRNFIEHPSCPNCEYTTEITQEGFEQEVKDLVGEEYTVVGKVTTRSQHVDIRHNVCGYVQGYKPQNFLTGSRCTKCFCSMTENRLEQMLKEYADERYAIVGYDNGCVVLFDNEAKKEVRLKNKHIAQEILRPTASTILPTTKKRRVRKTITTWEAWYQLCKEYRQEFGHLCVGKDEKYKEKALGGWCADQRTMYHKGLLSDEQVQMLKDIDFAFDAMLYHWYEKFKAYKEYVESTGELFPRECVVYNGNSIHSWFRRQRRRKQNGILNPIYERILLEYNPDFFKKLPKGRRNCKAETEET